MNTLREIDPTPTIDTETAPAADTVNAVVQANNYTTGRLLNVMQSVVTKLAADAPTSVTLHGASPKSETQAYYLLYQNTGSSTLSAFPGTFR
jgi:hypothetical protein